MAPPRPTPIAHPTPVLRKRGPYSEGARDCDAAVDQTADHDVLNECRDRNDQQQLDRRRGLRYVFTHPETRSVVEYSYERTRSAFASTLA